MTVLSVKCYMNPQKKRKKKESYPEIKVSIMWKIKNSLRFLSSCIHSFPKQVRESLCRRIAGEYLWRNQNTDYISHAYYWGNYFKH